MKIWPFRKKNLGGGGTGATHPFLLNAPLGTAYTQGQMDARNNALIVAAVAFLSDAIMAAPVIVRDKDNLDIIPKHPVLDLLRMPAVDLDWGNFVDVLIDGLINDGLVYIQVKNSRGNNHLAGLQLVPHYKQNSRKNNDGTYTFTDPDNVGQVIIVSEKQVFVFRYRKGRNDNECSPLRGVVLDEIMTDTIRAFKTRQYMAKTIAGSPYISLKDDKDFISVPPEKLASFRELLRGYANSENGEPIVSDMPMDVTFQPSARNQIDWTGIAKIAESRVCGALRIRPEVLYTILGSETTRVGATMAESIRESWRDAVLPLQNKIARKLTESILPMFPNTEQLEIAFDNSRIVYLADDERAVALYDSGIATGNEARTMVMLEEMSGMDEVKEEPEPQQPGQPANKTINLAG